MKLRNLPLLSRSDEPLRRALLLVATSLTLAACGDETAATPEADSDGSEEQTSGDDASADDSSGGDDGGQAEVFASCNYTSVFTQGDECREYTGDDWTEADVTADCDQWSGDLELAVPCAPDGLLGNCELTDDAGRRTSIYIYGDDPGTCADQQLGCENFGGGDWNPSPACEDDPGDGPSGNVFIQPTLECQDPIAGEGPGNGPDGQVCTWQSISGATEEGRKFVDYASCDVVRTQRPYYPAPPAEGFDQEDERLEDETYVAELTWVRNQIESSACTCCHTESGTPIGPSNWYTDQPGNFMNGFKDTGLALGAGWIDSTSFGAYDPEDNNGFDRVHSGFPTTDPQRMVAFFIAELERRGRTEESFADNAPFGGPLYDQMVYEPGACENGEGVDRNGRITWEGADARYVYVLDAGAANPTVPPNLDLPEGTRWRVDVPSTGTPIASGDIVYGQAPNGMSQRFPAEGTPAALTPGEDYYLYVTRDVGIPLTRCLFTY
ncbi:MAG: hypothetical protein AAF799_37730 [Myxococcota bacterium]